MSQLGIDKNMAGKELQKVLNLVVSMPSRYIIGKYIIEFF
jgi:hypothetical protein